MKRYIKYIIESLFDDIISQDDNILGNKVAVKTQILKLKKDYPLNITEYNEEDVLKNFYLYDNAAKIGNILIDIILSMNTENVIRLDIKFITEIKEDSSDQFSYNIKITICHINRNNELIKLFYIYLKDNHIYNFEIINTNNCIIENISSCYFRIIDLSMHLIKKGFIIDMITLPDMFIDHSLILDTSLKYTITSNLIKNFPKIENINYDDFKKCLLDIYGYSFLINDEKSLYDLLVYLKSWGIKNINNKITNKFLIGTYSSNESKKIAGEILYKFTAEYNINVYSFTKRGLEVIKEKLLETTMEYCMHNNLLFNENKGYMYGFKLIDKGKDKKGKYANFLFEFEYTNTANKYIHIKFLYKVYTTGLIERIKKD